MPNVLGRQSSLAMTSLAASHPAADNVAQAPVDHQAIEDILKKAVAPSPPSPITEKGHAVPFTLTLQEEKSKPGQFQLVVNINPDSSSGNTSSGNTGQPKKLYANLQALPGLGYDVSPLYRTQTSSPPSSPQEPQGWSDLDGIPPDFLKKVVPEWGVTLDKNISTMSNQPNRLADIKAKIKKSGKGFVVRLLKGTNPETNEVAEVHLAHQASESPPAYHELDSTPCMELDAANESSVSAQDHFAHGGPNSGSLQTAPVFEIGSSSEMGVPRPPPVQSSHTSVSPSAVPRRLIQSSGATASNLRSGDDWHSDAETLTHDIRSLGDPWEEAEDDHTDIEPSSTISTRIPTRAVSISSVVPTPTRGLSVVGPVERFPQDERTTGPRQLLNRTYAKKSFKRRSDGAMNFASDPDMLKKKVVPIRKPLDRGVTAREHARRRSLDEPISKDSNTWHYPQRGVYEQKPVVRRRSSFEPFPEARAGKKRLKLRTKDVPRDRSANTSPVARRIRGSPSTPRREDLLLASGELRGNLSPVPPAQPEIDEAEELRAALEKVSRQNDFSFKSTYNMSPSPKISYPEGYDTVGEIPLPPGLEIRQSSISPKRPIVTFVGLVCAALASKLVQGLTIIQDMYGNEPPVPSNHVRVRWTCSCGEQLYDDFIEKRRGAARLLEAYLNRPRMHTPSSPRSGSASSTFSSVFSSSSMASTLATPQSTWGGSPSWGQGDSSKYSPTRWRSNNPFSVRIGSYPDPQWLLTCANEGRFTPKIVHLDVNASRIKSDKDLALALREHYSHLNRKWFRALKLRGLTTIDFVQFEVHRNRFADIRKSPDMPSHKSEYDFEPVDLIPPVGSRYLLHLFKHPEDYDGELIAYLRSPKRRSRLDFGVGWGINLVEGFHADRVWTLIIGIFVFGSVIFAVVWACKRDNDVQGAFGVAGWMVTLAALALGWAQAWLE